jgi:hypothetical protein
VVGVHGGGLERCARRSARQRKDATYCVRGSKERPLLESHPEDMDRSSTANFELPSRLSFGASEIQSRIPCRGLGNSRPKSKRA